MSSSEKINGRLKGRVAIITGAASGIGRACVERFLIEGAKVVAADVAPKNIQEYPKEHVSPFACDVTSSVDAEKMVDFAISTFDRLDILINSAGISARNAIPESNDPHEIWDRVLEVNLKGTYLASWYAVPAMKESGGGSILNLASIMGLVGYPAGFGGGFNAYPPSKGGVVQFTKTLANDLAKDGIRVNCLCPGFVETQLTESLTSNPDTNEYLKALHPMGRLGQPDEIANAALFLSSDEASFITGASLAIDGGYTSQ